MEVITDRVKDDELDIAQLCRQVRDNKVAKARAKTKKQYNTTWKPWFHKKPFELMNGYNHVCEKCGRKLTQCLCIE